MKKVAERHPRPGLTLIPSGEYAGWTVGEIPKYVPDRKNFFTMNMNGQLVQGTWHGTIAEGGGEVVEIERHWISGNYTDSDVFITSREEAENLLTGSRVAIEAWHARK